MVTIYVILMILGVIHRYNCDLGGYNIYNFRFITRLFQIILAYIGEFQVYHVSKSLFLSYFTTIYHNFQVVLGIFNISVLNIHHFHANISKIQHIYHQIVAYYTNIIELNLQIMVVQQIILHYMHKFKHY